MNPIQPILKDEQGRLRFKKNKIVEFLLNNGRFDMNSLATMNFTNDDRRQFAQLIGYSLNGYGELSYVDDKSYSAVLEIAESGITDDKARIKVLEEELDLIRDGIRDPVARLFGIHPNDLKN